MPRATKGPIVIAVSRGGVRLRERECVVSPRSGPDGLFPAQRDNNLLKDLATFR